MVFQEPKVEFIPIDCSSIVTSGSIDCSGSETEPGGGVVCSNSYWITTLGDCGNNTGSAPQACTSFC